MLTANNTLYFRTISGFRNEHLIELYGLLRRRVGVVKANLGSTAVLKVVDCAAM